MAASTRYVVLFVNPDDAEHIETEGVFAELPAALAYVRELNAKDGLGVQHFEVEGWRGRDFQGCWNHEGKLVEDRKGRAR